MTEKEYEEMIRILESGENDEPPSAEELEVMIRNSLRKLIEG